MKRKALLRDGDHFDVLEEGEFQAETALQEALKRNPEVLPVADLDLDEVVVVGRETGLPAGYIDLLLVDAAGRVLIVETKLAQNPELRRAVVAQLLDYGASLWATAPTLAQFEALVLRYWRSPQCQDRRVKGAVSLRQGLEACFREARGEDWDYEAFEAALAENLEKGRHVLLIVAHGLLGGISNDLLRYANLCLDMPLYGVEIDVFEAATRQLIVPRGVRYLSRRPALPPPGRTDRVTFLAACTEPAAAFFERLLHEAEEREMIVYWGTKGFSIRMPLKAPVTVMYGYPPDNFQVYTGNWPLDAEALADFRGRLAAATPFKPSGEFTNVLRVNEKSRPAALAALEFMWKEVAQMMGVTREEQGALRAD